MEKTLESEVREWRRRFARMIEMKNIRTVGRLQESTKIQFNIHKVMMSNI